MGNNNKVYLSFVFKSERWFVVHLTKSDKQKIIRLCFVGMCIHVKNVRERKREEKEEGRGK